MLDCDVPMIAAINGHAIGLGLDLACVCDMRVAADSAKMAASFIKVGIIPGDGGAWTLQKLIGYPKAAELFLTGRTFDAGLCAVHRPCRRCRARCRADWTRRWRWPRKSPPTAPARCASPSACCARPSMAAAGDVLELSAAFQALVHETADHKGAVNALLEKRAPVFTGD